MERYERMPDCEGRWGSAQGESSRGAIRWMDRSRWWLEWGRKESGAGVERRGKEALSFCLRFRIGPPKKGSRGHPRFQCSAAAATGRSSLARLACGSLLGRCSVHRRAALCATIVAPDPYCAPLLLLTSTSWGAIPGSIRHSTRNGEFYCAQRSWALREFRGHGERAVLARSASCSHRPPGISCPSSSRHEAILEINTDSQPNINAKPAGRHQQVNNLARKP
jgi:hypothetical protein